MGKTTELLPSSSDGAPSGLVAPEDWLRISSPSPFIKLEKDQIHQTLAVSAALSIPATLKGGAGLWPEVFTLSWAIVLAQYEGSNAVGLDIDAINSRTEMPIQRSIILLAGPDNSIQDMLDTLQQARRRLNPPDTQVVPGQPNIDRQALSTARVSLVMSETETERDILTSNLEKEELLRVVVIPSAHGSRQFCHAQYSSAIDSRLGPRFLYQFVHVARQIVSHLAGCTVQQLDMLTRDDRVTLQRWAATPFSPISSCFHHLVAAHAQYQPSSPAVSAWDGELSYAELDALSGRIASRLIQERLPKGTIVPLLFEKSKWMVISILAVHKAGGACVGLCTSHPDSYLRSILEQTGASRILSSPAQASRLEGLGYTSWAVPHILDQPSESADEDANSLPTTVASDAQDLAYVIFTSGSTGKPKGVLLTHQAISTSAYYHGLAVNVQPTSRILQFSSYAFDMSVIETWYALARGGCLCIPSETQRLWHLPTFIAEHRASWAFFTPTLLRGYHPTDLSALDTIVLGGENVTQDLVRRWESHVRLFDLWGPAESAGAAGCEIVRDQWIPGTFGRGAGCTLWIVQPGDVEHLAAIGAVGEVVIEGHIVAQGYLEDPVRTAQVFIPPPAWRREFSHPVQGRFYKTGDLGQYNPDGTVRYVSRKDTVVKINGQRVDLDAVETAIRDLLPERQVAVDAVVLQGRSGRTDPALLAPTLRLRLGWALLLSLYSGTDDVVFGTVVDGRRANLQGIETMAGPTLSTLPVRVRLPHDATVDETLRDMQESMMRTVQFEHSGLQHIARAGPDAAHASRFRTMLVVQADAEARESSVLGRIGVRLASMQGFSGYGLVLICYPDSGGCTMELLVDEKLVSLGVMIEHGQFSSAAIAQQQHLHINTDSRVLHLSSYSFDSFAVEILTALCSGASVCIPSDAQSRHEIAAAVQQFAATWAVMTPSMLRLLDPHEVPSLRTLVAVGESLLPSQATKWASRVQLICGYGPTECCTGASAQPIPAHLHREDEVMADIRNIGAGMGAHLWLTHPDDMNRLVPIGAVGEILIQGPIVGRGYLQNPSKTREVFIDTTAWVRSFSNALNHRLYRTSDLGRYNDDGTCTFLGRKTDQVKLNGQRLDLPAVEHCLRHALGSDCTVLAAVIRPASSDSHPVLIAMVHLGEEDAASEPSVPVVHDSPSHPFRHRHSAAFTRRALRAQAALYQSLPPVMVPSLFLQLSALPLLASGKANRPELQRAAATLSSHELALLGRLNSEINEERLKSPDDEPIAWTLSEWVAELSSKNTTVPDNRIIGRNVTAAGQGLDSIDMVALARRIAREYHFNIPATVLFQSTLTVRTIAEMVRARDVQLHTRSNPWKDYQRLEAALTQLPVLDSTASLPLPPAYGRRIFLTGGTGFLGTRILQQLVTNPEVQSVTVLVRDTNERSALARLVQAARHAQWWRDEYLRIVHVWLGDLRQPQLGLLDALWGVLCGHTACPSVPVVDFNFDTIIHNGAVVHWVRDYEALQPSNVQSTFELLRAVSSNPHVTRFLYVSALRPGEDHLPAAADSSDEMVHTLLTAAEVGYSQTKLVSELLVQRYAQLLLHRAQRPTLRLAIVRPGLMMGAVTDGIAHLDDVIWRTVSAALAIGGYNEEEADSWIYLAPVDWVATVVVQEALLRPCALLQESPDLDGGQQRLQPISIFDGLRVRDFWSAITCATGASLRAMSAQNWLVGMQESIQSVGEQHPLWPVVEFLEATAGSIGSRPRDESPSLPRLGCAGYSILWQTVARNIRYLSSVGYWDSGIDGSALVAGNVFRRG
ncbi:Nonribosomal peptide synthetase 8 [Penicillium rolfsii]|nr:Nonribosomal peptide synthetase 8 [Penicillium rolfsii]